MPQTLPTDPIQLMAYYSQHGITGVMSVGSNQVWKVVGSAYSPSNSFVSVKGDMLPAEDTVTQNFIDRGGISIPVSKGVAEKLNAPDIRESPQNIDLSKLTTIPATIRDSFSSPQTNTATINNQSDLPASIYHAFVTQKPEALDWKSMIASETQRGVEEAQRNIMIREISAKPEAVLGSMLSFHDPLGLGTLYYTGKYAVATLLGDKKWKESTKSKVGEIRSGYIEDVSSKEPLIAGLEKGLEAGFITGSMSLLPHAPSPIPELARWGFTGLGVARAIEEPTGEHIFFASLPLASWGLSKVAGRIKDVAMRTGYKEEYYSDYGSIYRFSKEGSSQWMEEVKLLGGRLEHPIPEKNYDVAVLLSEKGKIPLYTGDQVDLISNIKFRINRLGMMKPLSEELSNIELFYPKGFKSNILSSGTAQGSAVQLVDPFYSSDIYSKVTLNLMQGSKLYKSISAPEPVAPLLKGTSEDIFNFYLHGKMQEFLTGDLKAMNIIKLNVEPEKIFKPKMLESRGSATALDYPVYDVWATTRDQTLFEKLNLRDMSKSLGAIDLGEGKLLTHATLVSEKPVLAYSPRSITKKIPFMEEIIRYSYSDFKVGIPNILSGSTGTAQSNIPDMKFKPVLVDALKSSLKVTPKDQDRFVDVLMPKIKEESRLNQLEQLQINLGMRSAPALADLLSPKLDLSLRISPKLREVVQEQPKYRYSSSAEGRGTTILSDSLGYTGSRKSLKILSSGEKKIKKRSLLTTPVATWENIMITEMLFGAKALQPKITKRTTREFREEFFNKPEGLVVGRFSTQAGSKEPKVLTERIAKLFGLRR